jgi:hypothetical protein
MQPVNHALSPEELMAYLDGELPAEQAVGAAAHLEQCAECRSLADVLRSVSQTLPAWEVEAAGDRVVRGVMEALQGRPQPPAPIIVKSPRRRWMWALAGAAAVVVVALVAMRPSPERYEEMRRLATENASMSQARARMEPSPTSQTPPGDSFEAPTGPMIARTAQLQLTTRDFDHIRARLDEILKRHRGYFGELNVTNPTDAGRTLSGKLQVPAAQLDTAMSEIKQLGHVDSESQSGEEVTRTYTNLEARLDNSRHTEQRILDLLRNRTGNLSDVLDAEKELGRVRGEIEQMEAERKALLDRVDFATLTLTVTEEYKAQLHVADSMSTKFRNATVDGFRSMAGSVVSVLLFLLSSGPVILLWIAILFFPVRWAWRRWKSR